MEKKTTCVRESYDVIVVGAGHAGCEAAVAAARLGMRTALFTMNLDSLANLPCNPSIGGTAKGQLVREIDALGGIIAKLADQTAIQTRMLNRSKGAAVYSPRAQIDRRAYSNAMKFLIEEQDHIFLKQAEIVKLIFEEQNFLQTTETTNKKNDSDPEKKYVVRGAVSKTGAIYEAKAVIVCSGTYMESRIIIGETVYDSGPDGLFPSKGLSKSFSDLGIPMQRFKTGTPVRINARTADFSKMDRQDGEPDMPPFSFENEMNGVKPVQNQNPCWVVWTSPETKEIIFSNLDRSPLYSGVIEGVGPRYCPSIEDKFVKFPDKERHQAFVEPMGKETHEMYLQGMSSSMPEDVQMKVVHSISGLEHAQVQRLAYAIEYDCVDPTAVSATMESRLVSGLFTAGQINGSSGYEEAAAQGLIAGINAVNYIKNEPPFILDRSEAYIGVLIDDLVTKGTSEPYRMMTARAEYRLLLRQDNADRRLTPYGHRIGLVSEERYQKFLEKYKQIDAEKKRLSETFLAPSPELNELLEKKGSTKPLSGISLAELIRRPQISYPDLASVDTKRPELSESVVFAVETDLKYDGYIRLELDRIEKFKVLEKKILPPDVPYEQINGLRIEARQKLAERKPVSIGQASRISGVSPADISVLLIYMENRNRTKEFMSKEGVNES